MLKMSSNTVNVRQNLKSILDKLSSIYNESPEVSRAVKIPRLVAVSKTKPKEMIVEAYEAGQRHFGENYVQEMADKAADSLLLEKCPDIKWHFIGTVQSNKVAKIVKSPNLTVVETVASQKLADKFQSSCKSNNVSNLGIMIQVNTSGEENKGGIEPSEVVSVVKHVQDNCPNLSFQGLMTIGALAHSVARETTGPNPDFLTLIDCRKRISKEFELKEHEIELSMGMSNDFEEAIQMGSTNIRVGSSIFGARNYPAKPETAASQPEIASKDPVKGVSDQLEATEITSK